MMQPTSAMIHKSRASNASKKKTILKSYFTVIINGRKKGDCSCKIWALLFLKQKKQSLSCVEKIVDCIDQTNTLWKHVWPDLCRKSLIIFTAFLHEDHAMQKYVIHWSATLKTQQVWPWKLFLCVESMKTRSLNNNWSGKYTLYITTTFVGFIEVIIETFFNLCCLFVVYEPKSFEKKTFLPSLKCPIKKIILFSMHFSEVFVQLTGRLYLHL